MMHALHLSTFRDTLLLQAPRPIRHTSTQLRPVPLPLLPHRCQLLRCSVQYTCILLRDLPMTLADTLKLLMHGIDTATARPLLHPFCHGKQTHIATDSYNYTDVLNPTNYILLLKKSKLLYCQLLQQIEHRSHSRQQLTVLHKTRCRSPVPDESAYHKAKQRHAKLASLQPLRLPI